MNTRTGIVPALGARVAADGAAIAEAAQGRWLFPPWALGLRLMVGRPRGRQKADAFPRGAASGPDRLTGIVRLPIDFPNRDQCGLRCGDGGRSGPSSAGTAGLSAASTAEGLSA